MRPTLGLALVLATPTALAQTAAPGGAGTTAQGGATVTAGGSATAEAEAPEGPNDSSFDPGGQAGFSPVGGESFALASLTVDAHLAPLQMALRAPLRFKTDTGDVRRQDWDEAGDFFRVGQCVRFDTQAASTGGSGIGRPSPWVKERGLCQPWR